MNFTGIKAYKRTVKKKQDIQENKIGAIQNNLVTGGAITDTFHVIEDVKPKKRPMKPKQHEPTTKEEKCKYFINFKFT